MKHKYVIGLDGSGIDEMLRGVEEYKRWIERKTDELAKRLADMGAVRASFGFSRAVYNGVEDHTIDVERVGEAAYKVKANGETVLFVEFGTGVTYGYGHPEVGKYGPGTYPPTNPNNPHWDDPNGWWIPKEKGGGHTYGNPPNAPMYNTVKDLEREIEAIAREVFSS